MTDRTGRTLRLHKGADPKVTPRVGQQGSSKGGAPFSVQYAPARHGVLPTEEALTRINQGIDADWNTGTLRINEFGYPVTLLMADIEKA